MLKIQQVNSNSQQRFRAIDYINQVSLGKLLFNKNASIETMKKSLELFKVGIEILIRYAKAETNQDIRLKTCESIKQFLNEASKIDLAIKEKEKNQKEVKIDPYQRLIQQTKVKIEQEVTFDQIVGIETAKECLKEAIVLPMKFPEIFVGARKPWKGILLYGPPGTGKTFLAKACASLCSATFFSVSASDLMSKYVGESGRLIKALFQEARNEEKSIIFIDEIDSILGTRESVDTTEASKRFKTEFLVQMDGVNYKNNNILILGATNLPWLLDPAVRRRFEKKVYIPLPDYEGRVQIIKLNLMKNQNTLTDQNIKFIAKQTEFYSGSDLKTLVREAAFGQLRKCFRATHFKIVQQKTIPCSPSDPLAQEMTLNDVNPITLDLPPIDFDDFMDALLNCKSSINQNYLEKYENWTNQFGQK